MDQDRTQVAAITEEHLGWPVALVADLADVFGVLVVARG
jgi:hypothetical protein